MNFILGTLAERSETRDRRAGAMLGLKDDFACAQERFGFHGVAG